MALVIEEEQFQFILRMLNTNINGRKRVPYAMTDIPGIGVRFSILMCKKIGIDINKRAGELTPEEVQNLTDCIQDPLKFGIPKWFVNRPHDYDTGAYKQIIGSDIRAHLRTDLERMKRVRCHRGVRHHWGVKVRGQQIGNNGRGQRKTRLAKYSSFN